MTTACVCAVRKHVDTADAACKYVAGYNECATQLTHYLTSLNQTSGDGRRDSLTEDARCCLLDHVASSLLYQSPSSPHNSLHSTPVGHSAVGQSASSSLPPPPSAVYVISPQQQQLQVPVTSSTAAAAHVRLLPAACTLGSGGQLVLLLAADSSADNQARVTEPSVSTADSSCDVITLQPADAGTGVFRCTGDEIVRECKTEGDDVDNQSEPSSHARDQQQQQQPQNTDDLQTMWRPW